MAVALKVAAAMHPSVAGALLNCIIDYGERMEDCSVIAVV